MLCLMRFVAQGSRGRHVFSAQPYVGVMTMTSVTATLGLQHYLNIQDMHCAHCVPYALHPNYIPHSQHTSCIRYLYIKNITT